MNKNSCFKAFSNNLGNDEHTFLEHHFVDSDVDEESDFTNDESNGVPEQEPIEFHGEEKDNDDEEDEEIVGGDYNKPKLS